MPDDSTSTDEAREDVTDRFGRSRRSPPAGSRYRQTAAQVLSRWRQGSATRTASAPRLPHRYRCGVRGHNPPTHGRMNGGVVRGVPIRMPSKPRAERPVRQRTLSPQPSVLGPQPSTARSYNCFVSDAWPTCSLECSMACRSHQAPVRVRVAREISWPR